MNFMIAYSHISPNTFHFPREQNFQSSPRNITQTRLERAFPATWPRWHIRKWLPRESDSPAEDEWSAASPPTFYLSRQVLYWMESRGGWHSILLGCAFILSILEGSLSLWWSCVHNGFLSCGVPEFDKSYGDRGCRVLCGSLPRTKKTRWANKNLGWKRLNEFLREVTIVSVGVTREIVRLTIA